MLTPQQIQFYRDSGYLGVENVFDEFGWNPTSSGLRNLPVAQLGRLVSLSYTASF